MDLYPLTVTLGDGTRWKNCKARFEGGGVTAWRWDKALGEAVVVVQSNTVVDLGRQRWQSGDVTLVKACSCGGAGRDPIRTWRPPAEVGT